MRAVTEIADPGLERGRVVLPHNLAICLDGSVAGDGSPLARVVDEAEVDGLVLLEVVCLARLGVGVEEEIEAVALLRLVSSYNANVMSRPWAGRQMRRT
jgi:hypothetical protein